MTTVAPPVTDTSGARGDAAIDNFVGRTESPEAGGSPGFIREADELQSLRCLEGEQSLGSSASS